MSVVLNNVSLLMNFIHTILAGTIPVYSLTACISINALTTHGVEK